MLIVDAHEDVAVNALYDKRDMHRSALETRANEKNTSVANDSGLCMVGLPEWLAGRVGVVFGTIFAPPARPAESVAGGYTNAEEAYAIGRAQLDYYHHFASESEQVSLVTNNTELTSILDSWKGANPRVGIVVLLEGADPIRVPSEAETWYESGVRLVGLSWGTGSRYAGGNERQFPLTDTGRELLSVMADLGMVLDVSHLAEEAFYEATDRFEGVIIASHANPRARVPGPRQLSDAMIRRLVDRDGVIGVIPYNRFLKPGWTKSDPKEVVTLDDLVGAVDHICQVVGDAAHVGIGSDFDGGFGAESAPEGLDTVADLPRIGEALARRGYSENEVTAVMGENWLGMLRIALPD